MIWYIGMLVWYDLLVSQGIVGYDVSIVGYGMVYQYGMVCQYGMMLVSQDIVGYDMVWYGMLVLQGMVWYSSHACMNQK